jgi:hypothetical protein
VLFRSDYGFAEAKTTYGVIGIKVWVFKGEVLGQTEQPQAAPPVEMEKKAKPQRVAMETQQEAARKPKVKHGETKAIPAESPRTKTKPKREGEAKGKVEVVIKTKTKPRGKLKAKAASVSTVAKAKPQRGGGKAKK